MLNMNLMMHQRKKKMFNSKLPQSQPTLEDGPDGTGTQDTSQTDSLKTLTISSSDLWSEPMPSKDKPAMVRAATPMVISSSMKHLPNRPLRKFLPPIRVLLEVNSRLISENIGVKHGDTSMWTVLVQLESSESHNSWDSWHPTNTCLSENQADYLRNSW